MQDALTGVPVTATWYTLAFTIRPRASLLRVFPSTEKPNRLSELDFFKATAVFQILLANSTPGRSIPSTQKPSGVSLVFSLSGYPTILVESWS